MELMDIGIELLSILFVVAIIAGFIDTLAGGGGLLTIPALMISGMSPLMALGTNKLQASGGSFTATVMMLKHKRLNWKDARLLMLFSFIGAVIGALIVQTINIEMLSWLIPLVLIVISIYFLLSPYIKQRPPKHSHGLIHKYVAVPGIGAYDGMFGPGTGSFFSFANVSLKGHGLIEASALARALNFASNIASLIVFISLGKVIWLIGLVMMVGQFIGAWLGSHSLLKINPQHLRYLIVFMCLIMLGKYIYSMS